MQQQMLLDVVVTLLGSDMVGRLWVGLLASMCVGEASEMRVVLWGAWDFTGELLEGLEKSVHDIGCVIASSI